MDNVTGGNVKRKRNKALEIGGIAIEMKDVL